MDQVKDGEKSEPSKNHKREEQKGGLKNRGGEKTKRPDRSRAVRVDPHDRTISAGL